MNRAPFALASLLSALAACATARHDVPLATSPAPERVAAPLTPPDPCAELYAPLAPLPGAATPPEYPFVIRPPDASAPPSGCAFVGPPCATASAGAQGLLQRVELVVPITEKRRSRAATEARGLEIVRALRSTFGLSTIPAEWTRAPGGELGFDVDPADGFGRVRFTLETRPEMADDWHGTILLDGITGLRLGPAKPIPKERILERLLGRRYCVDVPTGEIEQRSVARVCDPPAGFPRVPCGDEKISVPVTRREIRTVAAEGPTKLRAMLQLTRTSNEGANLARLVWAVWRAEEPTNWESTLLVDAFTGATFSSYQLAGAGRIAAAHDP